MRCGITCAQTRSNHLQECARLSPLIRCYEMRCPLGVQRSDRTVATAVPGKGSLSVAALAQRSKMPERPCRRAGHQRSRIPSRGNTLGGREQSVSFALSRTSRTAARHGTHARTQDLFGAGRNGFVPLFSWRSGARLALAYMQPAKIALPSHPRNLRSSGREL